MAALWSFGTVSIYVKEDEPARDIYRAEIKVLDQIGNVLQDLGAGSKKHMIRGLIVGQSNMDQLDTWASNGTSQTFTSDQGSQGSYKINGTLKSSRVNFVGATVDGVSYTTSTALYNIEMELISTA